MEVFVFVMFLSSTVIATGHAHKGYSLLDM